MLARPNSDAFIWISELAAKYIVICALGLDPQLQQRIAERVSSWQLIPDTHVLLAYLSSGDDRHEQANQLLKATHRLKASLIFAESVLEESIHHAELAKKRFEEFRIRVQEAQHDFPERKAFDVIDPFDNAYIKGFAYETADKFLVSKWPEYISQFVKLESLRRTLSAELTGAEFPTDDADIIKVGQIYAEHKTANYEEGVGENQTLRLQWDGRLLAMCARRNDAVPTGQRLIILTDSESIRSSFVAQIQPNKRSRTALARPAAIAAAMTLVPGTAVNLQCVRVLLFDELRHAIKNLDGALIRREPKRFLRQGALEECIEEEMLGDKASSASPSGSPTPILR
jgi:predicted nucleic acid-binding protein